MSTYAVFESFLRCDSIFDIFMIYVSVYCNKMLSQIRIHFGSIYKVPIAITCQISTWRMGLYVIT